MATYIERENSGGPLAIILMIVVLAAAAFGVYYFMDRDAATPATDTTIIETPANPVNETTNLDFSAPATDVTPESDTTNDNNM